MPRRELRAVGAVACVTDAGRRPRPFLPGHAHRPHDEGSEGRKGPMRVCALAPTLSKSDDLTDAAPQPRPLAACIQKMQAKEEAKAAAAEAGEFFDEEAWDEEYEVSFCVGACVNVCASHSSAETLRMIIRHNSFRMRFRGVKITNADLMMLSSLSHPGNERKDG